MCGITGFISNHPLPVTSIERITSLICHRGPDDEGFVLFESPASEPLICGGSDTPQNVYSQAWGYSPAQTIDAYEDMSITLAFGHRRLSIVDLSPLGHQPMCTQDRRYWIVYNGEVYNHIELRQELEALGYRFLSHSDTEVVLAAYAQWGADCLHRFIGMWAFAIYDTLLKEVFLARDPFGIKPLFYSNLRDSFAFASEIAPLFEQLNTDIKINSQKIYEYLQFGFINIDDETMLTDIKQLPPAHYLKLDVCNLEIKQFCRYWQPELKRRLDIGFDEAAKKLKALFLDSVTLHLRSDVPVGAALSGGIDSSAIVCAIRYLNPKAELHTFTYVAEEARISEEKWADLIGQHVGAIMHKVSATPSELLADLDHLIHVQGEPFGSTSIYAQHKVFRKAQEVGIKVMLDGQGADELLGGYSGFVGARLASMLGQFEGVEALRFLLQASSWPGRNRNKIIVQALKYLVPTVFLPFARTMAGQKMNSAGFKASWFLAQNLSSNIINRNFDSKNYLRAELAKSLEITSLPALLRYEDRNSMAHSIESRVPFLNKELVDFIYSLPEHYLIDNQGTSKAIFRHAMRGLVPDAILDRRDKIGFETPEKQWLLQLSSWVENTMDQARHTPFLDHAYIQQEWQKVMEGQRKFDWQIWRWLNFLRWMELFEINELLDGNYYGKSVKSTLKN